MAYKETSLHLRLGNLSRVQRSLPVSTVSTGFIQPSSWFYPNLNHFNFSYGPSRQAKHRKHLYEGQHKQYFFKKINVNIVFLKNVQMIFTYNRHNKLVQQYTKGKSSILSSDVLYSALLNEVFCPSHCMSITDASAHEFIIPITNQVSDA